MPRHRVVHVSPIIDGTNAEGDPVYPIGLSLTDMEELLCLIDAQPVNETRLAAIRRSLHLAYKKVKLHRLV